MGLTPLVHRPSGAAGGDKLEVESGGEIEVKSGGVIDVQVTGGLSLAAGEIEAADIAGGAVSSSKLATGAVTEVYIGSGAVTSSKLGLAAVSETYLATGAVTVNKIGTGAVTSAKLGLAAVSETYLATGAVTSIKQKTTVTKKPATAVTTVYLEATEAGVIDVYVDGCLIYLPTYVGNTGLVFKIKATATHSSGTAVYADAVTGGKIDGAASKTSGAQYDVLEVVSNGVAWQVISKIGTWS